MRELNLLFSTQSEQNLNFKENFLLSSFSNVTDFSLIQISLSKFQEIFSEMRPLTLPYQDINNQIIQLGYSEKYGLLGGVLHPKGSLTIIPADNIHNPLDPNEKSENLLNQLINFPLKKWDFVFDTHRLSLTIWPHLIAAGKYDRMNMEDTLKDIKKRYTDVTEVFLKKPNGEKVLIENHRAFAPSRFVSSGGGPLNRFNSRVSQREARKIYLRDEKGKILKGRNGKDPYNHRIKVIGGQNCAKNIIEDIKSKLGRSNLEPQEREELESWLSKISITIENSKKFTPSAINYKPSDDDDDESSDSSSDLGPGKKQFEETLQKTGLTKSYDPENPVPKGGGNKEIGGVGCTVELIKGLFESPESLFEIQHSFFIPEFEGGQFPFNDQECCQILHELARGIFVYNTIPFFSLHFNHEANLYPVIHPVYENTLVGQVFGMLDYFMKGYLNGGIFQESFLKEWHKNPIENELTDSLLEQLINFKNYAKIHLQGNDKDYRSVRDLLKIFELNALEKAEQILDNFVNKLGNKDFVPEDPIFKDYTKFSNSFRIIAKQKGIHKAESMFMIDSDFDVEYTIEPDPDYKRALEEHYKFHGDYPIAYQCLLGAYELMKKQIHDHMIKMPFCRKYFAMLGVINFFSYYFKTLKLHHKIPLLPTVNFQKAQCPSLFPPLPLLSTRQEELTINPSSVVKRILQNDKSFIKNHLSYTLNQIEIDQFNEKIVQYFWEEGFKNASAPLKRHLSQDAKLIQECCQKAATVFDFLSAIKKSFWKIAKPKMRQISLDEIVNDFLNNLLEMFSNKLIKIASLQFESFLLPSEQTSTEIEIGKKIVGGCGMITSPLQGQSSPQAKAVLNVSWTTIQKAKFGKLSSITSDDPEAPKGVIFNLPFKDIPLGFTNHPSDMELLLASADDQNFSHLNQMDDAIRCMSKGNEDEFRKVIESKELKNIRDGSHRTLLHHSVRMENTFFTKMLLQKGFSKTCEDQKKYLPIHYAAMAGHVPQLKILLDKENALIHSVSNQGATPLIVAIQNGQYAAAEYLISMGSRGDEKLKDGYTALHCAVHHEDEKMVKLLLEKSSKAKETINIPTNEGVVPLMIACQLGSLSIVAYLIQKGANPQIIAKNGTTCLEIAVKKNHLQLCQLLAPQSILNATVIEIAIKKSSLEVNQILSKMDGYLSYTNSLKETALLMAIRYANIPVAMLILRSIPDHSDDLKNKNRFKETAIQLAVKGKFYSLVEELIRCGAQTNLLELFELLLQTGYQGQYDSLNKIVLSAPISKNTLQALTLKTAKAGNHVGITNLLMPLKPDLSKLRDKNGWSIDHYLAKSDGIYLFRMRMQAMQDLLQPLKKEDLKTIPYIAGENGSLRVLEFIINKMKSLNISFENHYKGRTLFYSVLQKGNIEGVRLFIEKTDPSLVNDPVDHLGNFPVHLAAQYCSLEVLEFLFTQGANFHIMDAQGHYPLYYAILRQDEKVVKFLLNNQHSNPITANSLYIAASFKNETLFNVLCTASADLNESQNPEGNTALFLAIERHDQQAVRKLLQNGASIIHRNKKGWTPFLLATDEGEIEIMKDILTMHPEVKQDKIDDHNALYLANQKDLEHCVQFLIENKFSMQEANSEEKIPLQFNDNTKAATVFLNLSEKNQKYQLLTQTLQKAVLSRDFSSILKSISKWPINSYFTINLKGKLVKGTLLHFILNFRKKNQDLESVEDIIFKLLTLGLDHQLRDSQGNSYAHIMFKNKIDPTIFDVLDLRAVNNQKETLLHLAAEDDDINCLNRLILKIQAPNLDPVDLNGKTPLFYAIQENKLKNVKLLAKAGANLNHFDYQGLTPLMIACYKGNYPIIRSLIKRGADINASNGIHRASLLTVALLSKREEIPLFLLLNGAKLNSISNKNESIAHFAAAKGKLPILRFLAEQGLSLSSVNEQGLQPIHKAAAKGKIKIIDYLNSQGISLETLTVNTSSAKEEKNIIIEETPILIASSQGTKDAVKWLIDHGVNLEKQNSSGLSILENALKNTAINSQELIRLFKDYLFIEDLKHLLPAIHLAIIKDYIEPLKILYGMGIPIDSKLDQEYTGLHYACKYGSLNATEFFLTNNADCKAISASGELPIELSAANKSFEQFQLMLNYTDVDLHAQNNKGETLTHIATREENLAHVMLLIDLTVDVNKKDSQGFTPLHIAAEKKCKDLVSLLIICGANPDAETSFTFRKPEYFGDAEIQDLIVKLCQIQQEMPEDSTPIHFAVRAGHFFSVSLTSRLFDVNKKNILGRTPLHDAVSIGSLESIRELIKQGADCVEEDLEGLTPLDIACSQENSNPLIKKILLELE